MDITLIESAIEPSGYNLYAIIVNKVCLVKDFINSLEKEDQKKVINLFQQILTTGTPFNEEKFRHIGDQIYELKTRRGVRILCFYTGQEFRRSLILTHGFKKPHQKILKREKKKAVQLYNEYFSSDEIHLI